MPFRSRTPALFMILATLAFGRHAFADTIWPGPCGVTLQACIDGAPAGDTMLVALNGENAEPLTIDKDLILRSALGFSPVLTGGLSLRSTATPSTIFVEHLAFTGPVNAQPGVGKLEVHIVHNTMTSDAATSAAIEISSATTPPYGDVTADIFDNVITWHGIGGIGICAGIRVGPVFDSGTSQISISHNSINVIDCGAGGTGIGVAPGPGEAMTAEIIANRVDATGTNKGIEGRNFEIAAGSSLAARIVNNQVTGETAFAGAPAAISILRDGTQTLTAVVTNNTVVGNATGIWVTANGTALFGAQVANDLVANNGHGIVGLSISGVFNDHNLLFGNTAGDVLPEAGPGTVVADPLFAGPADYHLRPGSPAIDAGSNASAAAGVTTDLDDNLRPQHGIIDIGAFEAQNVSTAEVPTLGSLGLGVLGLLLAGAACTLLRTRTR